jgi:hypothetical protein
VGCVSGEEREQEKPARNENDDEPKQRAQRPILWFQQHVDTLSTKHANDVVLTRYETVALLRSVERLKEISIIPRFPAQRVSAAIAPMLTRRAAETVRQRHE